MAMSDDLSLPIVWVPGHLCGAWLYAPLLRQLGPGLLADVNRDADLGTMADRLLANAPERFVVAGLSMGAMVAMETMVRAPDRVLGAVLIATDPTAARDKERAWRQGWRERARREGTGSFVSEFAGKMFDHDPVMAAQLLGKVEAEMAAVPLQVFERQADALDARRAMGPLLSGYTGPVEVIVGAEDQVCPPQLHRPLAAAMPHAALTELPYVGHLATLEAADAITERFLLLLGRIAETEV